MLQRVYLLRCSNPGCDDMIMLPRRSRLGVFEPPWSEPSGEWPIDYRCTYCGQASSFGVDLIRSATVEAGDQNPDTDNLFCYEFAGSRQESSRSPAPGDSSGLRRLYIKGLIRASEAELAELVPAAWGGVRPLFVKVEPMRD